MDWCLLQRNTFIYKSYAIETIGHAQIMLIGVCIFNMIKSLNIHFD